MKLLLTSNGISNNSIKKAFLSLLPKSPKKLRIAMIQTASNIEDGDKTWLIDHVYKVKSLGFETFDFVDISALPKGEVYKRLQKANVLFLGGGNPFYLYYWFRKIGLDKKIYNLLKTRVYLGISAGSMVTNSCIAFKPKRISLPFISKHTGQKGIGLVDFSIRPHFLSSYSPDRTAKKMEKFARNFPATIYDLDDNSAIMINEKKIEVISEGKWKKIAANQKGILQKLERYMKSHVPNRRKPKYEYYNHVLGGRKYAMDLAKEYKANEFIVEASILLHDIGADAGQVHAQESARMAKKVLSSLGLDKNDKTQIINSIKTHSIGPTPKMLEQQIIQDADGLIFLEDTYKYFFSKIKNILGLENAKASSIEKTKGMMSKIRTNKGKKIAKLLLPKALAWLKSQKK